MDECGEQRSEETRVHKKHEHLYIYYISTYANPYVIRVPMLHHIKSFRCATLEEAIEQRNTFFVEHEQEIERRCFLRWQRENLQERMKKAGLMSPEQAIIWCQDNAVEVEFYNSTWKHVKVYKSHFPTTEADTFVEAVFLMKEHVDSAM